MVRAEASGLRLNAMRQSASDRLRPHRGETFRLEFSQGATHPYLVVAPKKATAEAVVSNSFPERLGTCGPFVIHGRSYAVAATGAAAIRHSTP